MSQTAQELVISLVAAVLFGLATDVAVREGSRGGAWISLTAFLAFALMAARLLWILL